MLVELARYAMYESIPRMQRNAEAAVRFYRERQPRDGMRVTALRLAGRARFWAGDYAGSAAAYHEALPADDDVATRLTLLVELADTELKLADVAGAERGLREALALSHQRNGETHVDTLHVETRLGALLHATGRRSEGRTLLASALDKLGKGPGTNTPNIVEPVRRNYASGLLADGRIEQAATMLAEDVAHARAGALRGLPLANALRAQALVDRTLGRYDAAQRELDEALAAWNATGGAEVHPSAGNALVLDRAGLQIARGDAAAALVTLEAVATPRDVAVMPLVVDETAARILSSQALLMLGRADEARAAARQALDMVVRSSVREYFPLLEADAALRLGQAQQRLGDPGEARASLERAVELRTANDDPQASPWLAEADAALASCLAALGERPAARALLQAAARIDANHPRLGAHLREPVARLALAK